MIEPASEAVTEALTTHLDGDTLEELGLGSCCVEAVLDAVRPVINAERDTYWRTQIDTLCGFVDAQMDPDVGIVQTAYLRRFAERVVNGDFDVPEREDA